VPPDAVTLAARIGGKGLTQPETIRVLQAIVSAMQFAHTRGLRLWKLALADILPFETDAPKLFPVFIEDDVPGTSVRDDLHRIGAFLEILLYRQPTADPLGALGRIAARCTGRADESKLESLGQLATIVADLASRSG
jgi:hypothetical protein